MRNRSRLFGFVFSVLAISLVAFVLKQNSFEASGTDNDYYVSPAGNDANPGTEAQPYRSLEKARSVVRGSSGSKIYVRAGEYNLSANFLLTGQDSGANGRPNMWVNYPGETPVVLGSWKVPSLTTVSSNVYNVSLSGTPAANANFRFIYHNGNKLLPARYPDNKPLNYAQLDPYQGTRAYTATDQPVSKNVLKYRPEDAGVINGLVGKSSLSIEIDSNEGIWYWHEQAGVTSINTATREITLSRSLPYNINPGNEYWIEGADSLLSAGEYYLNPTTKLLTVHLPTTYVSSDRLGIPIVDNLVTTEASNLIWQGFRMEEFNQSAFTVQRNANTVIFRNNEVRNGKLAFTTSYERNSKLTVDGNHLHDLEQGVAIYGGMYMKNLEDPGNTISNNYIHHIDLLEGRGNNAILVDKEQSKVKVLNNTVTDTARHGITFEGPMHLIKNNYVTRASQLRMDAGGLHTGSRSLLNQGTIVEGNFVENIGTRFPKSYGVWELVDHRTASANPPAPSFARMSDDWNSGEIERKNIYIQKWGPCISNHGGGYNTFENNYLTCGNTGFFFGGIKVGDAFFDPLYAQAYQKIQNMAADGYNSALYYQTFPHLRDYPAPANLQNGDIMRNNRIINNVFEGYRAYKLHLGVPSRYEFKGNVVRNNCNQVFRALYEPVTTPGTYSDLTKAEWQALGLDLDIRELNCSQPLFRAGTYEIATNSPAYGSGFVALDASAAGVRKVVAAVPTISLPSQALSSPTTAVVVDTKADRYGYGVAEIQYQIKEVGGAIGAWIKLAAPAASISTTSFVSGKKYSICVRQRGDALNLTNATADSLWVSGNCTPALTYSVSSGAAPSSSGTASQATPPSQTPATSTAKPSTRTQAATYENSVAGGLTDFLLEKISPQASDEERYVIATLISFVLFVGFATVFYFLVRRLIHSDRRPFGQPKPSPTF